MKISKSLVSSVLAIGIAAFAIPATAQQVYSTTQGDTVVTSDMPVVVQVPDSNSQQGPCATFAYESGDATILNTGRTVGRPGGGDLWSVYQPFVLAGDWTICSIGTDGWYVTGTPSTYEGVIYPTDPADNTKPDLANPIASASIQNGVPFVVNWADVAVTPFTLNDGVQYFFGTEIPGSNDHWSAIFNAPNGLASYSIKNGNFAQHFPSGPIALRLGGNPQNCPVDLNGDGVVDVLDFFEFIRLFNAGDLAADLNNDGIIDVLDFFEFIVQFNRGCN